MKEVAKLKCLPLLRALLLMGECTGNYLLFLLFLLVPSLLGFTRPAYHNLSSRVQCRACSWPLYSMSFIYLLFIWPLLLVKGLASFWTVKIRTFLVPQLRIKRTTKSEWTPHDNYTIHHSHKRTLFIGHICLENWENKRNLVSQLVLYGYGLKANVRCSDLLLLLSLLLFKF